MTLETILERLRPIAAKGKENNRLHAELREARKAKAQLCAMEAKRAADNGETARHRLERGCVGIRD